MAERCGEIDLSLYGRKGGELVEGVVKFKYMGCPLDQTEDDWPSVRRNVKRVWRVWGCWVSF